jgi:hypothetical protein
VFAAGCCRDAVVPAGCLGEFGQRVVGRVLGHDRDGYGAAAATTADESVTGVQDRLVALA